jgi:dTDP-glucose pyrophosphorylase
MENKVDIILTMAGAGSRSAEFSNVYKPFIKLNGTTILEISLLGLPLDGSNLVIVCQKKHKTALTKTLKKIKWLSLDKVSIVTLDGPTSGQAETALLGMKFLDDSSPLLVTNCDTFFTNNFTEPVNSHGLIGTFKSTNPAYSYVKTLDGLITETAEKEVISDRATAGLYYFSNKQIYKYAYHKSDQRGEKYIAPIYNALIKDQFTVREFQVDTVAPLGTKEELEAASVDKSLLDQIEKTILSKV